MIEITENHKAGFVNIVGKPNAGKSTLMNELVGERLSIITSKAQTTRHRILGIVNGDDFQIVYSDTPGYIKPKYELHSAMMGFVKTALEDADVLLYMIDATDEEPEDETLSARVASAKCKVIVLLNKIDVPDDKTVTEQMRALVLKYPSAEVLAVSALQKTNTGQVFFKIIENLPLSPPYYPKDELTDKPEKFFVSEMIREKIFLHYRNEIPYSSEVAVLSFKEEPEIIRIEAEIFVERDTQKSILIGTGGAMLKKVGTQARLDMEQFFQKKIFLSLHVKVREGWRNNSMWLRNFGYHES
jgi:GTP-binding protein Era